MPLRILKWNQKQHQQLLSVLTNLISSVRVRVIRTDTVGTANKRPDDVVVAGSLRSVVVVIANCRQLFLSN